LVECLFLGNHESQEKGCFIGNTLQQEKSIKEILNGYNFEIDVTPFFLNLMKKFFVREMNGYQWTGNGEMLSIPSPQACLQIQITTISILRSHLPDRSVDNQQKKLGEKGKHQLECLAFNFSAPNAVLQGVRGP